GGGSPAVAVPSASSAVRCGELFMPPMPTPLTSLLLPFASGFGFGFSILGLWTCSRRLLCPFLKMYCPFQPSIFGIGKLARKLASLEDSLGQKNQPGPGRVVDASVDFELRRQKRGLVQASACAAAGRESSIGDSSLRSHRPHLNNSCSVVRAGQV
ncbi:hypothetical protein THAOC_19543, partial [Thalassiosira oceanica]